MVTVKPWPYNARRQVFKCAKDRACIGGALRVLTESALRGAEQGANTRACSLGFAGVLCSSCAAGFSTKRKAGKVTKCSPCDPDSSKAAQMAVYGAIALAFVLARLQK